MFVIVSLRTISVSAGRLVQLININGMYCMYFKNVNIYLIIFCITIQGCHCMLFGLHCRSL